MCRGKEDGVDIGLFWTINEILHQHSLHSFRQQSWAIMSCSIHCGFARSLILEGTSIYHSSVVYRKIYDDYLQRFEHLTNFAKTRKYLLARFKEYTAFVQKHRVSWTPSLKEEVRKTFSKDAWDALDDPTKEKHSLSDCPVRMDYNHIFRCHIYVYLTLYSVQRK